ncbi:FHA domain-containing protein [Melaminivora suipulveris]|uniref:FHA domain-containing protein n=1 Tax=Melaminivora suipulveris TaxID=2109913 RepID=A0A2R3QCV8_9BURK|nr:FHA domain-containing protein [Melaminivora suipulveris]AVO49611.1 FHA domain-containing protein [Melaminivora suipulveris]
MPRMVVTIDGVVIKEVPLTSERTTVGRRPYNHIVIDHLAVSGEHAVVLLAPDGSAEVEDLGSTNGTTVNGQPVQRQALRSGDTVEMGHYKLRYLADEQPPEYEKTVFIRPGMAPAPVVPSSPPPNVHPSTTVPRPPVATHIPHVPPLLLQASVRVVTGPAAGREVALTKVVTTLGKPGVAVASITRRPHGFVLAHVEGEQRPLLNGQALATGAVPLHSGDRIGLAGTEMEFVQG